MMAHAYVIQEQKVLAHSARVGLADVFLFYIILLIFNTFRVFNIFSLVFILT